jgi:hypothetical protein
LTQMMPQRLPPPCELPPSRASALAASLVHGAAERAFAACAKLLALLSVKAACLRHLDARIALPLDPPADWRRDAKLGCTCRDCGALAAFLGNPSEKSWAFAAAEARRKHVEATISAARSDVTVSTERVGSPHRLVCTKNQASYARRCKQREQDLAAIETLRIGR